MKLNDYQRLAIRSRFKGDSAVTLTASGKPVPIEFAALGLAGEAGEIANIAKKVWREHGEIHRPEDELPLGFGFRPALIEEMGDALWYLALLARCLGTDLESIAAANLEKLGVPIE